MPILRRYGVSDTIYFPMITRAAVDFATSSVWTPVGSDTRVQIDTASASYATNLVTATGSRWALTLTAAELTGKKIGVFIVDAATKAVEDQDIEIETYGNALAQQQFDYDFATITLSGPTRIDLTNQIWATASRTLSSFGTLQGDVVNAVWATPSRTLSSFGTLQLDVVNATWATPSRTLSSFGTLQGDTVNAVWATPSRTLSSFGTLQGDVVNAVWATGSRTLSATSSGIRKNVALANFEFLMTDSTNHNPATGLAVTVTRSIDNGAFGAGTLSAVTEIAVGVYSVDFAAGDLNGRVITLRATAAASDDLLVTIVPDIT